MASNGMLGCAGSNRRKRKAGRHCAWSLAPSSRTTRSARLLFAYLGMQPSTAQPRDACDWPRTRPADWTSFRLFSSRKEKVALQAPGDVIIQEGDDGDYLFIVHRSARKPVLSKSLQDKSGSTWLHKQMQVHPNIFVPKEKDLYFFDQFYNRGIDWYNKYFASSQPKVHSAIGEICHNYIWSYEAPKRMKEYNKDMH